MGKARRTVFIPDNVPGHVFQIEEDSATESAKCGTCGLALSSFLCHPCPEYDQLKVEAFRRARAAWSQLQNCAPFKPAEPAFVHYQTDASKWAVHNYDSSRP